MNLKFDDSSSDEESVIITHVSTTLQAIQTIGVEESKEESNSPIPTMLNDDNIPSVHSELTKHAEALEKDMDSAMADLHDPEYPSESDKFSKIDQMIQQAVTKTMEPFLLRLQQKDQEISILTEKYQSLHKQYNKSNESLSNLQTEYERLNRQLNFVSRAIEVSDAKITSLERETKNVVTSIDTKINQHLQDCSHSYKD